LFLRQHWYVAAWDDELGDGLLARTILNENLVLFRRQDGTPVALEDRCAHRRLPLSMGKLIGDTVQCGYHGIVYDCAGRCIKVPGQSVPHGTQVKSYPTVERHRFIYVWMGDPAQADESQIVSFPLLSHPEWGATKTRLHVKANYLLVVDNLLDLSHVAYVHDTTIGNAPVAEDAEVKTTVRGDRVRVTREMIDVPAARTYADFGRHSGNLDRWQLSEFIPPSYFLINNGSAAALSATGTPRLEGQGEWGFQVYHGITPETERSTHQFWVVVHPLLDVPAAGREEFYRQCHQVIWEDLSIYEAQQRALDTDLHGASAELVQSRVAIHADKALLQARRIINALLAKEQKGQSPRDVGLRQPSGTNGTAARHGL
jgi:phenylpropionate dioxygenase-like ring-hydroxylating dioxygenase large terminal subunit